MEPLAYFLCRRCNFFHTSKHNPPANSTFGKLSSEFSNICQSTALMEYNNEHINALYTDNTALRRENMIFRDVVHKILDTEATQQNQVTNEMAMLHGKIERLEGEAGYHRVENSGMRQACKAKDATIISLKEDIGATKRTMVLVFFIAATIGTIVGAVAKAPSESR
jgi:hypothetical protein